VLEQRQPRGGLELPRRARRRCRAPLRLEAREARKSAESSLSSREVPARHALACMLREFHASVSRRLMPNERDVHT